MHILRLFLVILLSLAIILPSAPGAYAKRRSHKKITYSGGGYNPKYSDIVVNADTGKVLHEEESTALRHPASLTKMMTLYLLFEKLHNRRVSLNDMFSVSAEAASRPQTNMSLSGGDRIEVEDAIHALVIRSANDVAVVVAENLAGSEAQFASLMTAKARQLGMKNTVFKNANGLHNPAQVTTARDFALLGIALKRHFPEYYHYFGENEFTFRGKTYETHNRVTRDYPGADGIKTGFITASGFNLVTSASRRGVNLVGVVLGGKSIALRDRRMTTLLDEAFADSANDKFTQYPSVPAAAEQPAHANDNAEEAPQPAATTNPTYVAAQAAYNAPKATDQVVQKITAEQIAPEKTAAEQPAEEKTVVEKAPAKKSVKKKPVKKKSKKKRKKKLNITVKTIPARSSPQAQPAQAN